MPRAYLAVRAEVPADERERFDQWYETDHLPGHCALSRRAALGAAGAAAIPRAIRVHVAFYEFDSVAAAEAATAPEKIHRSSPISTWSGVIA